MILYRCDHCGGQGPDPDALTQFSVSARDFPDRLVGERLIPKPDPVDWMEMSKGHLCDSCFNEFCRRVDDFFRPKPAPQEWTFADPLQCDECSNRYWGGAAAQMLREHQESEH